MELHTNQLAPLSFQASLERLMHDGLTLPSHQVFAYKQSTNNSSYEPQFTGRAHAGMLTCLDSNMPLKPTYAAISTDMRNNILLLSMMHCAA